MGHASILYLTIHLPLHNIDCMLQIVVEAIKISIPFFFFFEQTKISIPKNDRNKTRKHLKIFNVLLVSKSVSLQRKIKIV